MIFFEALEKIMTDAEISFYSFYNIWGHNEAEIYARELKLKDHIKQYECTPLENRFLRVEVDEEDRIHSILVALFPYDVSASSENTLGIVDGFSYGYDYHLEIKNKLNDIYKNMKDKGLCKGEAKAYVDNSPYIDREIALYGGLGKYGKNQMLIHPEYGSQFFIGYLVFKELLHEDHEHSFMIDLSEIQHDACLSCDKCEKACPVGICTFEGADASKCVGMLTQTKRILSAPEKTAMGRQLYGCSICQRVCPLNHKSPKSIFKAVDTGTVDVNELLLMTNKAFKARYGHMAFSWRSLWVYKRNVLINMGNAGKQEALDFLLTHSQLGEEINLSEYHFDAISKLQKRLK